MNPAPRFDEVYAELRRIAAARLASESPGQTLDATALIHEAYLRLADASSSATSAESDGFMSCCCGGSESAASS